MSFDQGHELDPSQNQNTSLDTCPDCGAGRVQADGFEKVSDGVWFAQLECPDCNWSKTRVLDEYAIDELDEVIDERALQLKAELKEIEKTSPEELVGAFATANNKP